MTQTVQHQASCTGVLTLTKKFHSKDCEYVMLDVKPISYFWYQPHNATILTAWSAMKYIRVFYVGLEIFRSWYTLYCDKFIWSLWKLALQWCNHFSSLLNERRTPCAPRDDSDMLIVRDFRFGVRFSALPIKNMYVCQNDIGFWTAYD